MGNLIAVKRMIRALVHLISLEKRTVRNRLFVALLRSVEDFLGEEALAELRLTIDARFDDGTWEYMHE